MANMRMRTVAMTKPRSHQLDIYGAWLHLATDRKQWAKLRRTINKQLSTVDDVLGLTCLVGDDDTRTNLCIYLDMSTLKDAELIEVIAHEATHAGALLLDHIGQTYDGESEALAYLVGYVASWCWAGCVE